MSKVWIVALIPAVELGQLWQAGPVPVGPANGLVRTWTFSSLLQMLEGKSITCNMFICLLSPSCPRPWFKSKPYVLGESCWTLGE